MKFLSFFIGTRVVCNHPVIRVCTNRVGEYRRMLVIFYHQVFRDCANKYGRNARNFYI